MHFRGSIILFFLLYKLLSASDVFAFQEQKRGSTLFTQHKAANAKYDASSDTLPKPSQPIIFGKLLSENALNAKTEELPPNIIQTLALEHFSSKEGFANEEVTAIHQDRHGFLWVLTLAALYRYDGQIFKRYVHNQQDSTSLLRGPYMDIHEDINGILWICGTHGLQRYIPQHDNFERIRFGSSPAYAYTSAEMQVVKSDKYGNLWLCIGDKVCLYNSQKDSILRWYKLPKQQNEGIHSANALYVEDNGRVWATQWTADNVYVLDNPSSEFRIEASFTSVGIQPALLVHRDSLWIGVDNGVVLWNIRNQQILAIYPFTPRFQITGRVAEKPQIVIRRIIRDTEGRIWVASSDGLKIIYPESAHIQTFGHNPFDERSLTTKDLNIVYQDRSGVMWIGETVYGLHKYSPLQYKFHLQRHNPFQTQSLSNGYIRGITEDLQGNIWVGTQFGGLNMLDRTTGSWKHFRYDSTRSGSISSDHIRGVYTDRKGILWIAVRGGLLCTFDPKHPERGFKQQTFIKARVYAESFFEDRSGYLWIATSTSVPLLYRLSPDRTHVEELHSQRNFPLAVANGQHITQDRQGRIWIAGMNGLVRYDSATNTTKHFQPKTGDSTALAHPYVTYVTETRSGDIWIATKGGGICRFIPETESFATISVRDGLPHDNCYGILEDNAGNLWISTDNGLCAFSPQTQTMRKFGVEDGLQSNEFNRLAVFRSKRGEMFFGGVDGLNSFFPFNIRPNPIPPKPAFLTMRTLTGTILAKNITLSNIQRVEIPPQSSIALQFAALEFTTPKNNLYSWHLDGFDKAWSPASQMTEAVYSNLPPDEYTFRLRVANADGKWSSEEAVLQLVVLPAWWQYWYVQAAMVLCFVSFGVLIVRLRVRRVEIRAKELEKLVSTRTVELLQANRELQTTNEKITALNTEMQEVMGIVSHDLKNPIAAVIGFVDVLRQSDEMELDSEQTQEVLRQISITGERMMTLLKNLLDVNALEYGTVAANSMPLNINMIACVVVEEYKSQADAKDITLHFVEATHDLILGDEMMTYQIFVNLVSNAVKYSPSGKNIHIITSNGETAGQATVRFSVRDEGPGISATDREKLFKRFMKLSARPTAGEDSTGLGLFIVKKMVEAMNGKVWCESEHGQGATFIVEFPLQPETLLQTYKERMLLQMNL